MRAIVSTLMALVCVLVLAAGASGSAKRIPWLTFNEVTLDGKRHVLSKHDVFPYVSSLSPNHDQLAYVQYTCDGCGRSNTLMVADVGSPRQRLLVQAQDGIYDVAWAPDGRSIALLTNGIWLIDVDGSDFRRVADSRFDLAWSPNSKSLAFTRNDRLGSYISVLSLETGEERVLSAGFRPRWSPDGRSLLFEYATGRTEELKIRVVGAGGGEPRTIARGSFPSWSPDGSRIAFVRDRDNSPSVWVASSRGGRPRLLVNNADTAVWSPDSRRIAVSQGQRYCASKLTFVRADGGRPRRLATHTRIVAPLAWSKTSRKVLYMGQRCSDQ